MMNEIEKLLNDYWAWLKDKTVIKKMNGDWVEITTPYLDRHNDCLQIYARRENGHIILTDDGYTIEDLASSGRPLDTPERQELLRNTLAAFGIQMEGDRLSIRASPENFPLRKHNMIQAILAINDLFYLASPYAESLFFEDVTQWMDLSDIRYTPKVKLSGKSGYDHMFDFVIPKSRKAPERIVQALSNPKKDSAEALVFKWIDTRETRATDSQLLVFLNNNNTVISPSVIDAFKNYEIKPVLWDQREQERLSLAA